MIIKLNMNFIKKLGLEILSFFSAKLLCDIMAVPVSVPCCSNALLKRFHIKTGVF